MQTINAIFDGNYFNADNKVREKILEVIDNEEELCITVINVYEI
jgi:hypothetical protein